MQIFGKFILCKSAEDTERTMSGVYKGMQKDSPIVLEIVNIGNEVSLPITKGDKILVLKYSSVEVEIDDKEFIIIKENDIVAKLTKNN